MTHPFELEQELRDALPKGWSAVYQKHTIDCRRKNQRPWILFRGPIRRRFATFKAALAAARATVWP